MNVTLTNISKCESLEGINGHAKTMQHVYLKLCEYISTQISKLVEIYFVIQTRGVRVFLTLYYLFGNVAKNYVMYNISGYKTNPSCEVSTEKNINKSFKYYHITPWNWVFFSS